MSSEISRWYRVRVIDGRVHVLAVAVRVVPRFGETDVEFVDALSGEKLDVGTLFPDRDAAIEHGRLLMRVQSVARRKGGSDGNEG